MQEIIEKNIMRVGEKCRAGPTSCHTDVLYVARACLHPIRALSNGTHAFYKGREGGNTTGKEATGRAELLSTGKATCSQLPPPSLWPKSAHVHTQTTNWGEWNPHQGVTQVGHPTTQDMQGDWYSHSTGPATPLGRRGCSRLSDPHPRGTGIKPWGHGHPMVGMKGPKCQAGLLSSRRPA